MSGGRASGSGIRAPETSTGITVTSERRRAVPTSSRTKSPGSAIRTPSSSSIVAHLGPMTTISTWQAPTAAVIRCTKSIPGSRSTSMNTLRSPNWGTMASYRRPA